MVARGDGEYAVAGGEAWAVAHGNGGCAVAGIGAWAMAQVEGESGYADVRAPLRLSRQWWPWVPQASAGAT